MALAPTFLRGQFENLTYDFNSTIPAHNRYHHSRCDRSWACGVRGTSDAIACPFAAVAPVAAATISAGSSEVRSDSAGSTLLAIHVTSEFAFCPRIS